MRALVNGKKNNKFSSLLSGTSGDSVLLVFVKIVTLVFGLLMTRVLSGYFSLNDYGTYSQIILLSSTITTLTILGLTDGINYFFCKEQDVQKRDNYVATIFFLQLLINVIVSVVILSLAVPISEYFNNLDVKKLIIFAAAIPLLQNTISLLQVMFIAVGKAKHIAIRNLVVSILKLIAVLLACYLFNNIVVVLVCQVVLEIAQILYFYISLRNENCVINIFKFDLSLLKEILKYCVPMAMFTIIKSLNRDCDKYVIAAFTNTETLAIYSNASKLLPFDIIMSSFATVLFPYLIRFFANKEFSKMQTTYKAFLELSYVVTTIMAMGAICVAPELMKFLYTEKYISGIYVFVVYIVIDIISVLNLTMVLSSSGKTKTILLVSILPFVANIGLSIVFYKWLEMMGPAIATFVVTLVQGIIMLTCSAKAMKTTIINLFNKKFLCLFILELTVMVIVTYFVRQLLFALELPWFLIMCICFILFAIVLALLNAKRIKNCLLIINKCKQK